jgi:hypothetical protein
MTKYEIAAWVSELSQIDLAVLHEVVKDRIDGEVGSANTDVVEEIEDAVDRALHEIQEAADIINEFKRAKPVAGFAR